MIEENINIEIVEERPDHHYRTELPNIVFSVLTPIQLAVYAHLKRIAGDNGKCWMSIKNIADNVGIGETTFRESVKELAKTNVLIGLPFIRVYRRKKPDGSADTSIISIVDIWRANGDFYRKVKSTKPAQNPEEKPDDGSASKTDGGGGSPNEGGVVRQAKGGGSPNEDKEEPSQEEPLFVCSESGSVTPPASEKSEKSLTLRVIKRNPQGGTFAVSLQDMFSRAVQMRTNWTADEIHQAWDVLVAYSGAIRDAFGFMKGTIENFRRAKTFAPITKKTKESKCPQKKTDFSNNESKPSNEPTLKLVSLAQALQNYNTKNG